MARSIPTAPAPPVPCSRREVHLAHFYGAPDRDLGAAYRCPGRRHPRRSQGLPTLHIDVAWTLATARELAKVLPDAAHRHLRPSGNLLVTMAQVAAELEGRFAVDGWKVPVMEYTDSLRHLAEAYASMAAATRQPYLVDGEPQNGATLEDLDAGQLATRSPSA